MSKLAGGSAWGARGAQKAWPCLQTLPLLPQAKHPGVGKGKAGAGPREEDEAGGRPGCSAAGSSSGAPRKGSAPHLGVPGASARGSARGATRSGGRVDS